MREDADGQGRKRHAQTPIMLMPWPRVVVGRGLSLLHYSHGSSVRFLSGILTDWLSFVAAYVLEKCEAPALALR